MINKQKAELLKGWEALTPAGKNKLLEYLDIFIKMEDPKFQKQSDAEHVEFLSKLENAHALGSRLEEIAQKTREVIHSQLPDDIRILFVWHELLTSLIFAAQNKPTYLYEQNGAGLRLAKKAIRATNKGLAKLESGGA